MKQPILHLKSRIEENLYEVESYYDSIHLFLSQAQIINDNEIKKNKISKWLHDNRYTISILEEILEKIEHKNSLRYQ